MLDYIIKGGMVVTAGGVCQTDIAVAKEKIAALGEASVLGEAVEIIDASGKYVLPGLIDPHVHIAAPFMGCTGPLDFYSASKAAALGGVTSIIDFTNTQPGDSVLQKIEERKSEMRNAAIDYGVHAKIVEATEEILGEIKGMVKAGCPTLKMFTTYRKAGVMIPDEDILRVMLEAKKWGARPGVHAEDNAISEYNDEQFEKQGKTDWKYHYLSKPPVAEGLATAKMIYYAKFTGTELYIFHVTCREALKSIIDAQEEGYPIIGETCLHYLNLTKEVMDDYNTGFRYICSPPLRDKEDNKALWEGLKKGNLRVVSSDNCLYDDKEKTGFLKKDTSGNYIHDYKKIANGVSGLEERLSVLMTEGVGTGRISLEQLSEITSTNPAKIFGMYPKKGVIQPGSDADLVLVDPEAAGILSAETLHYGIDSSIYEGKKVKGLPVLTMRRGEIIAKDGKFLAKPGTGEFLHRSLR
ncbi:dihydropyrimidinase [Anaerocolumna sp. MB42-C2]|uniref:dihydropyrimidinase n=1 Tax=Anaerocolumna sp. MB42-C2 TaxID=3070997 RepID=UPI0027E12C90|nr:dihydropyrimidinase [Anaerocolumna sp. MB42-C2]WMJ90332.1 dihydropyrimidinase [Anaerocolumna sp. MB42-C2]